MCDVQKCVPCERLCHPIDGLQSSETFSHRCRKVSVQDIIEADRYYTEWERFV